MKYVKNIFKMVFGVIAVVLGIIALNTSVGFDGKKTDYSAYGGDAYTGIQNASADASNNVLALGNYLEEQYQNKMQFVGTCFIAFGVAFFLYGAISLPFCGKKEEK